MTRRPLAIIVGSTAHEPVHAALSLAAASAALGRSVSLYLHADAARLAGPAFASSEDARLHGAGVPTVAELIESVAELGVLITVCQSGLALSSILADTLRPGCEAGGLVDFLSRMQDAEIVLA